VSVGVGVFVGGGGWVCVGGCVCVCGCVLEPRDLREVVPHTVSGEVIIYFDGC
jgi:hypothetical protein